MEINGEKIQKAPDVKYLGVNIDENLFWNKQYKRLKCTLIRGLSSLRKLKNILPQWKLDQVYRALFESHLRQSGEVCPLQSLNIFSSASSRQGSNIN